MSEQEISTLQQAIHDQGHSWTAGQTSLSDLAPEEQAHRLGLRLEAGEMKRIAAALAGATPATGDYPAAWDWRGVDGRDWTTAVRDQQACGSCVAFATVAVVEAMLKRHEGDSAGQPDLSEAHLFFCGCGACCQSGWWPTESLKFAEASGVPDEECFPYVGAERPCSEARADWQERAVKVSGWQEVTGVAARKAWLATTGPMVACMAVYGDFFHYVGGVYRHTEGSLAGYHAIAVVGYSDADQAWLCKNSWGSGWGEAGWFQLGYGECGIDTHFAMYGVQGVSRQPSPGKGCNLAARLGTWRKGAKG